MRQINARQPWAGFMENRLFILLLIYLCLWGNGCTAVTPHATTPGIGLPASATPTSTHTAHPTDLHWPYKTPTPTLKPNITPIKTRTPTPTSTPPNHLDFPGWVADPDVNVLLLAMGKYEEYGFENLALWNATSGERFDLPEMDIYGYFWMPDGRSIGLIWSAARGISLVNTLDGSIEHFAAQRIAKHFSYQRAPRQLPDAYVAAGQSPDDPDFSLSSTHDQNSFDKRYYLIPGSMLEGVRVGNLATEEVLEVPLPPGYYAYDAAWSPIQPYLGVALSDKEPGMYLYFEDSPQLVLKVYEIPSMNVVASYPDVTFPNWSPDGTRFLYQPLSPKDQFFWENPPCIYDIVEESTQCFYDAILRHTTPETNQLSFSSLRWQPEQQAISYVYTQGNLESGGLCIRTLANNSETCFLEHFEHPGQQIIRYQFSPDGKYVSARYDQSCPYCDYAWWPQIAIADAQSGAYFSLGEVAGYSGELGLWRPKIK
ncbi:MAG: hypothetical protein AB1894_22605 [Chloroflexota bacterium]